MPVHLRKDEVESLVKHLFDDKLTISSELSETAIHNRYDLLSSTVAKLCVENLMLKKELNGRKQDTGRQALSQLSSSQSPNKDEELDDTKSSKPVTFKPYHVVKCRRGRENPYEDVPGMFKGDLMSDHLRGQRGLSKNISKYIEENPHIIFAPVSIYYCACNGGPTYHGIVGYQDGKLVADSAPAEREDTAVTLGPRMHNILKTIISTHQDRFRGFPAKDIPLHFQPPYRLFFRHNKTLSELVTSSQLDESDRECIVTLCDWFEENYRKEWIEAEELVSRNKINRKHYNKLFKPGELCLWSIRNEPDILAVCKMQDHPWAHNDSDLDNYVWVFNGHFRQNTYQGPSDPSTFDGPETKEVDITSLSFYPLRFAAEGTKEKLVARGHKFWRCRTRKLVCYRESGRTPGLGQAERRFMVDYEMLRRLYPTKDIFESRVDDLGEEAMRKEEAPDDDFLAMMPPHMYAFEIESKAWSMFARSNAPYLGRDY